MTKMSQVLKSRTRQLTKFKTFKENCISGDQDTLEYATESLYNDDGLARYIINHCDKNIDELELEIKMLQKLGYDDEQSFSLVIVNEALNMI